MIVIMTSCTFKYAFSTPGIKPHSAPANAAANKASGKWMILGKSKDTPTQTAASQPTISCPSTPMLNKPVRKANATAKPVKMYGVVWRIVSPI